MAERAIDQARRIHLAHVEANATGGHSSRDDWSHCQEVHCAAFRESLVGPGGQAATILAHLLGNQIRNSTHRFVSGPANSEFQKVSQNPESTGGHDPDEV